MSLARALGLAERCYGEGAGEGDWFPLSIGTEFGGTQQTTYAERDIDNDERWTLVTDYRGFRLGMDGGGTSVGSTNAEPREFNEWYNEEHMPLMDAIIEHIPAPEMRDGPVQMQVTSLDYNDYVGRIGVGRVYRGLLDTRTPLVHIRRDGSEEPANIKQLFTFEGLGRSEVEEVPCGDLCAIVGISDIDIGDSITDAEHPDALPAISVDEPTI